MSAPTYAVLHRPTGGVWAVAGTADTYDAARGLVDRLRADSPGEYLIENAAWHDGWDGLPVGVRNPVPLDGR